MSLTSAKPQHTRHKTAKKPDVLCMMVPCPPFIRFHQMTSSFAMRNAPPAGAALALAGGSLVATSLCLGTQSNRAGLEPHHYRDLANYLADALAAVHEAVGCSLASAIVPRSSLLLPLRQTPTVSRSLALPVLELLSPTQGVPTSWSGCPFGCNSSSSRASASA